MLERISAIHPLQSERNRIATLALIAASLGGIASNVAPDILSALNLLRYQSDAIKASGAQIAASGMEKVRFYDSTSFYIGSAKMGDGDGAYYVDCVNDGLAELKKDSSQQETILSLGFHNPFSYLLRHKPAEGGSSYLFMGNSITEMHMPSENQVFGEADLMVLPDNEGTHRSSDLFIGIFTVRISHRTSILWTGPSIGFSIVETNELEAGCQKQSPPTRRLLFEVTLMLLLLPDHPRQRRANLCRRHHHMNPRRSHRFHFVGGCSLPA